MNRSSRFFQGAGVLAALKRQAWPEEAHAPPEAGEHALCVARKHLVGKKAVSQGFSESLAAILVNRASPQSCCGSR